MIVEDGDAQRLAGDKGRRHAPVACPAVDLHQLDRGAPSLEIAGGGEVGGVVDEGGEMHAVRAGEMPEHVIGADLLALVRRIGHAMGDEQDVGHGC